jgi:hypothetical protein
MDALNLFSQFGLTGIVIGALFVSLWLLVKAIQGIQGNHASERGEWLTAYKENTEVLRVLTSKCE